jgi:arylsulfatase A-like enzyme
MYSKYLKVILLVLSWMFSQVASAQAPHPNIVLFFVDDLGYGDLGSYGHPYIRTPNLDKLAREGQRWTDFYVAAPVCSPSRGALLTGQLPVRSGLFGRRIHVMFPNDSHGIPASAYTLAEGLKDAGYTTGIFGKWHLGDMPEAFPTRHGFDYWFGLPYSNDMNSLGALDMTEVYRLRAKGEDEKVNASFGNLYEYFKDPKVEYWNTPLWKSSRSPNGYEDRVVEKPIQQDTLTKRLTFEAMKFIEENKEEPFFAYIPHPMPHLPLFPGEEFLGTSKGGSYGDVVEELDWSVGKIVEQLEFLGISDNTLVIFTSDNGPWNSANILLSGSSGGLHGSKGSTWEGGVREPAIFWWPKKIKPAVISEIGSTMDIYVTALALAGIKSPGITDGLDLSSVLFREALSPRISMPYFQRGLLKAYRLNNFKLHYYDAVEDKLLDSPTLYDLSQDPGELQDVAADHPDVVDAINREAELLLETIPYVEPIFDLRLIEEGL